jgi:isochorismate synthase
MISNILELPELLISKGLPFAIYCLPGAEKFNIVIQNNNILNKVDFLDIENTSGFVIADFDSAQNATSIIIKPDFVITEGDDLGDVIKTIEKLHDCGNYSFAENISISKHDYLERVNYLIGKLQQKELSKVVFSRVLQKELKKKIVISQLLRQLKIKYENAFINLFHLPHIGTWFGASPETLFKRTEANITTDALAGTILVDKNNKTPSWSDKEIEEQQLVSVFIESLLSELGVLDFEKTGPFSIQAGGICHLRTKFSIPHSSLKAKEGRFIAGLHPTPAVCGLPKAEAFLLIQKAEQHQRRYYSGFLGPWKINIQSQLFVNLRCAELDNNKLNIYVGGGLTASSIAEDEYMETIHKSKTLLSVVENL